MKAAVMSDFVLQVFMDYYDNHEKSLEIITVILICYIKTSVIIIVPLH